MQPRADVVEQRHHVRIEMRSRRRAQRVLHTLRDG
jgi:hypothetical protein